MWVDIKKTAKKYDDDTAVGAEGIWSEDSDNWYKNEEWVID